MNTESLNEIDLKNMQCSVYCSKVAGWCRYGGSMLPMCGNVKAIPPNYVLKWSYVFQFEAGFRPFVYNEIFVYCMPSGSAICIVSNPTVTA
jgi:hypothetical protein